MLKEELFISRINFEGCSMNSTIIRIADGVCLTEEDDKYLDKIKINSVEIEQPNYMIVKFLAVYNYDKAEKDKKQKEKEDLIKEIEERVLSKIKSEPIELNLEFESELIKKGLDDLTNKLKEQFKAVGLV